MGFRQSLTTEQSLDSTITAEDRALYKHAKNIQQILKGTKTVAMVGLSNKSERPSNFVASYLLSEGYQVIPVNPRADEILGQKSYPDLKSIPVPIDVVDIFRAPAACNAIVEEAIEIGAKAVWLQLGVINRNAANAALNAGLTAIMDACMKIEHGRYNGSLHLVGMNTGIISARRGKVGF